MPGKSGSCLIFFGRVLYAHSTISSKLSGFATSAMRQLYHQGHAARRVRRILPRINTDERGSTKRLPKSPELAWKPRDTADNRADEESKGKSSALTLPCSIQSDTNEACPLPNPTRLTLPHSMPFCMPSMKRFPERLASR